MPSRSQAANSAPYAGRVHAFGIFTGTVLQHASAVDDHVNAGEMRQPVLGLAGGRDVQPDPARDFHPFSRIARKPDHLVPLLREASRHRRSDQARRSRHQNSHPASIRAAPLQTGIVVRSLPRSTAPLFT